MPREKEMSCYVSLLIKTYLLWKLFLPYLRGKLPTNILGWINFVVVGLPGIDQPGDHGAVVRRGGENLAN